MPAIEIIYLLKNLLVMLLPIVFQEIIEFPVLKVSGVTFETESTFHQYVEPQVHKELSPFCTEVSFMIDIIIVLLYKIDLTMLIMSGLFAM